MSAKPERKRRGFWRTCRIYFRRFRIAIWLLTLALLSCLIYLNQVGLPGFVKQPLLQKLRDKGLDLQFSRLRLRWYHGIVAEDVRFGQPDQPHSPQLILREVQVGLNFRALTRLQLQVDELILRHGRLLWLTPGDPSQRELAVENIQTHLRFLPEDQWALDNFTADFVDARIQLAGTVTNASAVAQWQFFHGNQPGPLSSTIWPYRLRRFADTLNRIRFSDTPTLRLNVQGDAKSLSSFTVRMALVASGAETPWGVVSGGRFTARLFAADSRGTSRAELNLTATDAQTPWASITNFQMEIRLAASDVQTNLIQGELSLSAEQAHTQWAHGSNVVLSAEWMHSITNAVPVFSEGRLRCDGADTKWGSGRGFELRTLLSLPEPSTLPACDASWAGWTNLHPYALEWSATLRELSSPKLNASDLACSGSWRAPHLSVSNLVASLYNGRLDANAHLDVASRRLSTSLKTDFDPHLASAALTQGARQLLDQVTWKNAPRLEGHLALTLPAWTNRQPDWSAEVQPTIDLNGAVSVDSGASYRQVEVSSARAHFSYSNLTWHLPDLILTRPEGRVVAEHRASDLTKDFYWRITSSVHPGAVRHLLDPETQEGFDLLALTEPPVIEAEVWGHRGAPELTRASGKLSLTNFSFRGESATGLQTGVEYTNGFLSFLQLGLQRGEQRLSADRLTVDFDAQCIYVTNGFSTADPMVVARAIGPHIARTIEPYCFSNPPTAYVEGTIPLRGEEAADLRFRVEGGPFHWWRFNVPWVAARLHWLGLSLTLRDVRASFYQGAASFLADFKFPHGKGCDFTCSAVVTNSLLQELMADVSTGTNVLEGRITGTLNFTRVNTDDWNTLFGFGEIKLRDGLIWDIPLFGIFTPILDGIAPGLGHTRASTGTCTYFITNGVIRTDDLEIRSPTLRLQYRGTVDLESRVNARVEAELLRDMWLVGPVVSTVLWPVTKMFEYRVTGTLGEPKTEPLYILPKLMFMPFHPFRTLKSLFPENPASRTNAPPVFKDY